MSMEGMLEVLGRAMTDAPFRAALLGNPDSVLGKYPLTQDELASIKGITPGQFEGLSQAFGSSGMGQDQLFKFFQTYTGGDAGAIKWFKGETPMQPPRPPTVPDSMKPPGPPNKPDSLRPPGPPNRWALPGVFVLIIAVLLGVLLLPPLQMNCGDTSKGQDNAIIAVLQAFDGPRGALGQKPLMATGADCTQANKPVNNALIPATPTLSCIPDAGGPQGWVAQPGVCTPIPGQPTAPGRPATEPPACVPVPGDGLCSACENTDLDSASCVCNMNGVCDPQEGFNCGDCQPTQSGPDGGGKKPTCTDPAGCP